MKEITVSPPVVALLAGTRVALGGGIALLLGDRLTKEQRRAAGWALVGVGLATTLPLMLLLFGSRKTDPDVIEGCE